jgi:hypothetical protein
MMAMAIKEKRRDITELLRLARNLETAVERMDNFSAWAQSGNRVILATYYNAVIRAAGDLRVFME